MGVWYLLVLLVAAVPVRAFERRRAPVEPSASAARRTRAVALVAGAGLVVTSFAARRAYDAIVATAGAAFRVRLPVPVLSAWQTTAPQADVMLGFAIVETVLLAAFATAFGALGRRGRFVLAGAVAFALAFDALQRHAPESGDIYSYVGLSLLGVHAYAPPAVAFAGDFAAINRLWGMPMLPSVYGPVWLGVSMAVLAPFATLAAKTFALKVLGLASVIGCAVLVRSLGAPSGVVAAVAANPALYDLYVTGAHNDLFAIDLVLAAMLLATRGSPAGVVAVALAVSACLCKIVLVPVALLAVAGAATRSRRAVMAVAIAGVPIAVYAFADGGALRRALLVVSSRYANVASPVEIGLHGLTAVVAVAAAVAAAAGLRVRAPTAWAAPSLAPFAQPWYLAWGLPFALARPAIAIAYLASLPYLSFVESTVYPETALFDLSRAVAVVGTIVALGVVVRRRPALP